MGGYVTEGVDMKQSCHTWCSIFSPTPVISQCVCVCTYVRVRVCVREGVDIKESCHVWSSVLFGVMSHRKSCLVGSLGHTWSSVFPPTPFISQCVCVCAYVRVCVRGCRYEGVISHMEFCLLPHTGHLDQTYRMKESCHVGRHVTCSIVYIKESWQMESFKI